MFEHSSKGANVDGLRFDDHLTAAADLKVHAVSGFNPQMLADLFRHGDLSLRRDGGARHALTMVAEAGGGGGRFAEGGTMASNRSRMDTRPDSPQSHREHRVGRRAFGVRRRRVAALSSLPVDRSEDGKAATHRRRTPKALRPPLCPL